MHKLQFIIFLMALANVAGAADAARSGNGSRMASSEFPCMTVDLPKSFRFVGSHAFQIDGIASGQRYLFAETAGKHISRLVVFQFESIMPGSSETYRYPVKGPELGGIIWRESQFAFSNAEEARENPTHEAATTMQFLKSKGYQVDDELMAERLATIPDPKRLHEAIIFYMENLADTGKPLAAFFHGDDETTAWRDVAVPLQKRGLEILGIDGHCGR